MGATGSVYAEVPDVLYPPLLLHQRCQYQHSHSVIVKIVLTSRTPEFQGLPMECSVRSAHWAPLSTLKIAGLSGLGPPEKQPLCGCYRFLYLFLMFNNEFPQHSASRSVGTAHVSCLFCLRPPSQVLGILRRETPTTMHNLSSIQPRGFMGIVTAITS